MTEANIERGLSRHGRIAVGGSLVATLAVGAALGDTIANTGKETTVSFQHVAYGQVTCGPEQGQVEGIWIATGQRSDSNFAAFKRIAETNIGDTASYARIINAASYAVHVGCGGNPAHWATQDYATSPVETDVLASFTCVVPTPNVDVALPPHHGVCFTTS